MKKKAKPYNTEEQPLPVAAEPAESCYMEARASQAEIPYWNILKNTSENVKKGLIVLLTQSLQHEHKKSTSAKELYGIWADDDITAEQAISELKSMRAFNRNPVEL